MTTNEYRRLMGRLTDAFGSLRSAGTNVERLAESERVKQVARELTAADCPRLKADEAAEAERLLDRTASYLISMMPVAAR